MRPFILILALLSTGCATSQFWRDFDAGYRAAAAQRRVIYFYNAPTLAVPYVTCTRTVSGVVNGHYVYYTVYPPVGHTITVWNGQTLAFETYTIY